MPSTYEPIATTTLGSSTGSVTFSSISGSYTDLILIISGTSSGGSEVKFRINSDTGSNYSGTVLGGNGSSAYSFRSSNSTYGGFGNALGTSVSTIIANFMNYSNTTTNKTIITRGSGAATNATAAAGLWRSTSAITSIVANFDDATTFSTGSTFTLYGIKAA
jgi:hypothetical protein